MGQQQLLLLVLGIVIVGLAVVVGIAAFTNSQQKSEVDRYTGQGVEMAGEIIAWYLKPSATGGGGQSPAALGSITIDDLGYEKHVTDTWAGYNRTGIITNGVVRYVAASTTHPFLHIHPSPLSSGQTRVEVHVFGPHRQCIVARNSQVDVSPTWSDGKGETVAPDNPNPDLCTW